MLGSIYANHMATRLKWTTIITALLIGQTSIAQKSHLVFSTIAETHEVAFILGELVLAAIAEESGLNLKLVQTPAKRSVTSLRQGLIDAEITRIPSFAETYPEGIMVSVPLTSISYFAYSARSDIEVKGWESLSPYKIVTVRGFQFVNEFLSGHQTQTVNSIKIALKFLAAGRADVLISSGISVNHLLKTDEFSTSGIKIIMPTVAQLPLHTFFRPELVEEARRYENAFIKLTNDGTLARLKARYTTRVKGI